MNKKILIFGLGLLSPACTHDRLVNYSNYLPTPVSSIKRTQKARLPSVDYIDKNRFRIHQTYSRVWDCTIDLMLKNYNLNIANKSSGLITTEWDSFYLDGKVYRNKLSIRVKKLNWNMVDVIVYNNVEILADNTGNSGPMIWLPEHDGKPEIGRIITNLAILLRMGKPNIPEEYVAKKPQRNLKSATR